MSISLDEPNTYLDQEAERQLLELIYSLKKEEKIIIIASHSKFMNSIVDHVYSVEDKRLIRIEKND